MASWCGFKSEKKDVTLIADVLNVLTSTVSLMMLCYALNLISFKQVIVHKYKADKIEIKDLSRLYMYFVDEKHNIH